MALASSSSSTPVHSSSLTWRPTKIMNVHDLSRDDDFLSHLLVEKLGTGTVPLVVHKMDPSTKLPKTDANQLMHIVRRFVITKGPLQQAIRQAVDELLTFPAIRYYLKSYTQKQINAFATHASRYFELYHPTGSIEIAHTSRYSSHTGKSELCVLATRPLAPGTVITELKGSMANLTDEEDKELKKANVINSDIRRDFSVIHSKSMKKNHLFLGPARFVNHDCDNNCELFREGRYITFRVLRPIALGEEITAHYGDGYFGKRNRHCLCETCEKNGKGAYSPAQDNNSSSSSSSDSDSDSDTSSSDTESEEEVKPILNLNERRTRRGVYAITSAKGDESDDSENDNDDDNTMPLAGARDIPTDREIELSAGLDSSSELTSFHTPNPPSNTTSPLRTTPAIGTPSSDAGLSHSSSSLTSLSSSSDGHKAMPLSAQPTPVPSAISARLQVKEGSSKTSSHISASTPVRRSARMTTSLLPSSRNPSGAEKEKAGATPTPTPLSLRGRKTPTNDEMNVKKEEVEARVLRVRPSVPNLAEVAKETSAKKEPPKGADGKLLPTCSTCTNVLPVISVDHKVVWGLGPESKRGRKKKQDCPRCMRHFAIYQQAWPCRTPHTGIALLSPRDNTPVDHASKSSKKVLRYLKRQAEEASISANIPIQSKKRPREDTGDNSQSRKKQKVPEPVTIKIKQIPAASVSTNTAPPATEEQPVKRKRGRPRLSSPRYRPKVKPATEITVKLEEQSTEIPVRRVVSQPRALNGRFGKKDKAQKSHNSPAKAKDHRADAPSTNPQGTWTSPRRKRSTDDGGDETEDYPRKKHARRQPEMQDIRTEPYKSVQKVMPRPASTFRGPRLVSNPNPLQFALRAWAGPVVIDDSSEEEEPAPDTPEDIPSPDPEIVNGDELNASALLPAAVVHHAPLIYKPSPFAFSKRRWVSLSQLPDRLANADGRVDQEEIEDDENESEPEPPELIQTERTNSKGTHSYSPRWAKSFGVDSDQVTSRFHLSPLEGAYPLRRVSDDAHFSDGQKHISSGTAFSLPDAPPLHLSPFMTLSGSTPCLINAGWDSSSDSSD